MTGASPRADRAVAVQGEAAGRAGPPVRAGRPAGPRPRRARPRRKPRRLPRRPSPRPARGRRAQRRPRRRERPPTRRRRTDRRRASRRRWRRSIPREPTRHPPRVHRPPPPSRPGRTSRWAGCSRWAASAISPSSSGGDGTTRADGRGDRGSTKSSTAPAGAGGASGGGSGRPEVQGTAPFGPSHVRNRDARPAVPPARDGAVRSRRGHRGAAVQRWPPRRPADRVAAGGDGRPGNGLITSSGGRVASRRDPACPLRTASEMQSIRGRAGPSQRTEHGCEQSRTDAGGRIGFDDRPCC